MSLYNFSLGVISIIILFGILLAGTASENKSEEFDYQALIVSIDKNASISMEESLEDSKLGPHFKNVLLNVEKVIVYGLATDISVGFFINELEPGIYIWIKENIWLALIICIVIMAPQVISPFIYIIIGLLLIIKEKIKKRRYKNNKLKGYI